MELVLWQLYSTTLLSKLNGKLINESFTGIFCIEIVALETRDLRGFLCVPVKATLIKLISWGPGPILWVPSPDLALEDALFLPLVRFAYYNKLCFILGWKP